MKFNAIAWNALRTSGAAADFRKAFSTYVEDRYRFDITVSTSIPSDLPRHVTFDSLSRKIASPEVTQYERTDISLTGHSFCDSSFRAPGRPSKSTRRQGERDGEGGGGQILRGKSEERASRCAPLAYDFDGAPARTRYPSFR